MLRFNTLKLKQGTLLNVKMDCGVVPAFVRRAEERTLYLSCCVPYNSEMSKEEKLALEVEDFNKIVRVIDATLDDLVYCVLSYVSVGRFAEISVNVGRKGDIFPLRGIVVAVDEDSFSILSSTRIPTMANGVVNVREVDLEVASGYVVTISGSNFIDNRIKIRLL